MKKMIAVVTLLALALTLCACGGKAPATDEMALSDIMAELYKGIKDLPALSDAELSNENFQYFAFAAHKDTYTAIASEAMISAVAHSAVLVRAADEAEAQALAKEISENKNPRKWICVEAEKSVVLQAGNIVLLVMSFENIADTMAENFKTLAGSATEF